MADTRSIQELPPCGSASARVLADGRVRLNATHAIALLRLIELEGGLDIRVTPGECDVLRRWPRWPLRMMLPDGSSASWARCAVELLQAGPPRGARILHLALLAFVAFAATWALLHALFNHTG